jgi:hypothetical protein
VTQAEGDSPDTTFFIFSVTHSGKENAPLYVEYSSVDGTATVAGNDYTATSGTLTFAANTTQAMITVAVIGDDDDVDDEDFSVVLSNPSGFSGSYIIALGTDTGTGTILDDDV